MIDDPSPILQDGLEKIQKAFNYAKQRNTEESNYNKSLRDDNSQSTLNEFGMKGSKWQPRRY